MKRFLCLLLSAVTVLCGCVPTNKVVSSYLRGDHGKESLHGQIPFADMVLIYPDPNGVTSALDQALAGIEVSDDPKSFVSVYETQLEAYNELVGAASLAYIRHCQDITDEERAQEYSRLNGAIYAAEHRLARLEKALMDRFGYHQEQGAAYANELDRFCRQDADCLRSLQEREDELCRRYERLDAEYRLTYRGRTWSIQELTDDGELSFQEFLEALEQYQSGKNQAAGELYLELLTLRRQMAKEKGYSSCAAAQYYEYGREYTPEQALAAAQTVKQTFVPLYIRLRERCENDLRYLSGATFREDRFLEAMERATERSLPGSGEAWRYMLAQGLYDSRPSRQKLQGSFTAYLPSYRCPFLFTQWTDDASSIFTVIHEFGHFLSYYMNPEGTYYASENLDLAETDAQGFEMLMLGEYDDLFGRYANAARLCFLTNALYAVISGFMEDEFQQRAYELDHPSVEDLNRLYGQLAKEYGFDRLFGYEGLEWTEISHTFRFPFYYVSYGVSMLAAMTLAQGGGKAYGRLLKRRAGASFSESVGQDVLAENTIRSLAAWAENAADSWLQE